MESKDTHQYLVIKGFKINMIANTKNKDDFCLRRGRKHSYTWYGLENHWDFYSFEHIGLSPYAKESHQTSTYICA